ncbi:MAG: Zn-ribbon domain-containing OB-fold protein [Sphingobium sp.]
MSISGEDFVPAVPLMRIDDGATPYLTGAHCSNCGVTLNGARVACPSCGGRDTLSTVKLGTKGKVYSYTIVHRSYPGVKTPFVAAVVDLDEGGSLKGTLLDVEADVAKLPADMPVEIVFRDTGQKNKEGKPFLGYYFVPAQGGAA